MMVYETGPQLSGKVSTISMYVFKEEEEEEEEESQL